MIKECITYLINHEYDVQNLNNSLNRLLEVDEDQLGYCLQNGINLMEDIILYKYPESGFRCMNTNHRICGRKPICNTIEKKLNERLQNLYFSQQ